MNMDIGYFGGQSGNSSDWISSSHSIWFLEFEKRLTQLALTLLCPTFENYKFDRGGKLVSRFFFLGLL